jgi:hypothetical protein
MLAPHQPFNDQPIGGLRGVEAAPGVGGGHREGLFAQHMLAGVKRPDRPLGVH